MMRRFEEPHESEDDRDYDKDTLEGLLNEIESIALDHELILVTNVYTPSTIELEPELSGIELDQAIVDLSPANIRDIREFERREGVKQGLQAAANLLLKRIEENDSKT